MPFFVNPLKNHPSKPIVQVEMGSINKAFEGVTGADVDRLPGHLSEVGDLAGQAAMVPGDMVSVDVDNIPCELADVSAKERGTHREKIKEVAVCSDEENKDSKDIEMQHGLEDVQVFAPWEEASLGSKVGRVVFYVSAPIVVLGMLYFFICALDILTIAFKLVAGRIAGDVFANSALLNNPVCGLMIGVLVTVLVQSSSTSSSIVVSLVASGVLNVRQAIPIIMGANIGTTITSVLVSLTQSGNRKNFQRSFSGATVHDMFNWCCVIILLPIEVATGYLYHLTNLMTGSIGNPNSTAESVEFLQVITTPLTNKIIQIDTSIMNAIAEGDPTGKYPMIRTYCPLVTGDFRELFSPLGYYNETYIEYIDQRPYAINLQLDLNGTIDSNNTVFTWNDILESNSTKCTHLFTGQGLPGSALNELEVGVLLLFGALFVIVTCLIILVKVLSVLMKGPMAKAVHRLINADFPGCLSFLTGYAALLIGGGLTILVQSSSVFIATLTPLVGIGLIEIERMYPLALGSNLGTTITGILAALTADADRISATMQIAFCHLFFNISGILIFYPVPFMRKIPIKLAKFLGKTTGKYRWFAAVYVLSMFLLLPGLVFGLSLAGWYVLLGVMVPPVILVIAIATINLIQNRRPQWLPVWLRSWDFLPLPLRSLEPYDKALTICCKSKYCCCCNVKEKSPHETAEESDETAFSSICDGVISEEGGKNTLRLTAFVITENDATPAI